MTDHYIETQVLLELTLTTSPSLQPPFGLKTRMQILSGPSGQAYTSVLNALHRITSLEGAKTLWRGVNSVILGAGPAHALYFGTYEVVKDMTGGNREGHQWASTGEPQMPSSSLPAMSDAELDLYPARLTFSTACSLRRRFGNHCLRCIYEPVRR